MTNSNELEKLKADPALFFEMLLDIKSTDVQKELYSPSEPTFIGFDMGRSNSYEIAMAQIQGDNFISIPFQKNEEGKWTKDSFIEKLWKDNPNKEFKYTSFLNGQKSQLTEKIINELKDKFADEQQRFRTHVLGEFLPIKAEKEKNVETKKS